MWPTPPMRPPRPSAEGPCRARAHLTARPPTRQSPRPLPLRPRDATGRTPPAQISHDAGHARLAGIQDAEPHLINRCCAAGRGGRRSRLRLRAEPRSRRIRFYEPSWRSISSGAVVRWGWSSGVAWRAGCCPGCSASVAPGWRSLPLTSPPWRARCPSCASVVVRLTDAGKLPARTVGTRRRLAPGDVLAFRDASASRRHDARGRMRRQAEDLGRRG